MKIALLGYGKMGKEIEQVALQRGHAIALKVDEHNASSFSSASLKGCDAAIEFSTPNTVIENIYTCFEAKVPVIVGTTGWNDKAEEVKKMCAAKNGSLFWSPNFSIGVNIFFRVNTYLAKMMKAFEGYDVSVEEIHHVHKLDSPSGTGIAVANGILENIGRKNKWVNRKSSNKNELEITSRREGEVPGTHIVRYASEVDDIEIRHKAHSRKGFALGAVLASEWIQGKKGIFTMTDMLGF